jgi:hypothetical protein
MGGRSHIGRLFRLALFAFAGSVAGCGAGLLASRSVLDGLDLRTEGILSSGDATVVRLLAPLISGGISFALPVLLLALGLVLLATALLLELRVSDKRGGTFVAALVGLLVGGGLAAATLVFADAPARAAAAMREAGFGPGPIIRAAVVPLMAYGILLGVAAGWIVGAALASSWIRKIALCVPSLGVLAAAVLVIRLASPVTIVVPPDAPQLDTSVDPIDVPLWLVGDSDEARRVDMELGAFFHESAKGAAMPAITRRNVTRARKAAADYPVLHPRSLAAEQLIAAGAMAELDAEGVVKQLHETFQKRGNPVDGRLLTTFLGRLAPTKATVKLLRTVSSEEFVVGSNSSKQLCALARLAGEAGPSKRLGCPGNVSKAPLSEVRAVLTFKGRPLRRIPVALVVAPPAKAPAWLASGGKVSAAAVPIVVGGRTNIKGEVKLAHVPPGRYLLAVAPSRNQAKGGTVKLDRTVRIEVPEKAGVVDLGEIHAGGPAKGPRVAQAPSEAIDTEPDDAAVEAPPPPPTALETPPLPAAEKVGIVNPALATPPAGESGKTAPLPADREQPLPRAAKRIVAKVQQLEKNRVAVPPGFGHDLLTDDRSIISPLASVVPFTTKAGRVQGLELRGIRSNGVEVALGFLEGDIIETVNGRPMREPDDLAGLVETLAGVSRVTVRVRRENRPVILRIDVVEE